jgi:hypothetical protein
MDIVTLHLFPPLLQHPPLVHDLGGRHRTRGRHDGTEFRVTCVCGTFPIRLPWETSREELAQEELGPAVVEWRREQKWGYWRATLL